MTDFPRTVDEITAEWLTEALRGSGAIRDAAVESFEIANIGDDQGIVGEVLRVSLNYDRLEDGMPRSVIAKLALADDEMRALMNSGNFYEVEARFYRDLASTSGMPTPRTYFADYDADTGYVNLLLEDLGHLRAVDQADNCSFEDASSALQSLARMHARWWGDTRLLGYSWLANSPDPKGVQNQVDLFPTRLEACLEKVADFLPAGFEAVARKFEKSIPEMIRLRYSGPQTLTHGDFRLANLFFDDAPGVTAPVTALDWQLTVNAKGAQDVGYFLCWSLATESRRQHEAQLLADYHDYLVELGVAGYSFDEFTVDARRAVLINLQIAVNVLGSNAGDAWFASGDGHRRVVAMCSRLQTLIDWNCEEVIPR